MLDDSTVDYAGVTTAVSDAFTGAGPAFLTIAGVGVAIGLGVWALLKGVRLAKRGAGS